MKKIKFADMFCGIGGFSQGAKQAGWELVYAANHWELACRYHDINHPEIKVACQDVRQLNWATLPHFDVLLASPACQGHSKARGADKPHHDVQRMTAWAVVDGIEFHRPEFAVVENVIEFKTKWALYPEWERCLNKLGYAVSPHFLDAADFGVPQHRERVLVAITKSKEPIRLKFEKQPHVPASQIIDWDYPKWAKITHDSHVPATLARIASGRARFGDRFVAPFYGSGSGETGRSIERPIGTVTTLDRWLVVDGDRCRVLQPHENLAFQGFPEHTVLPRVKREANHLIGNAVPPGMVESFVSKLAASV